MVSSYCVLVLDYGMLDWSTPVYVILVFVKCLPFLANDYLFDIEDLLEGEIFLQNLPSIVAAHALGICFLYLEKLCISHKFCAVFMHLSTICNHIFYLAV